ncbi:hypothetical protein N9K89_04560 [Schleiferiaceae bacterium]|nr:hypothetical protein [Schleiferiaceae bacterium]
MNALLKIYFLLPHDKTLGIFSKAFNRLSAKLIKGILDGTVPRYFLKTQAEYPKGFNDIKRDKEVIISLTSFPGRIKDVWLVVECLFRQSYKADRIILWLSSKQFQDAKIPQSLIDQKSRGLEIRFVEDDLRSHKKYFYAIQEFSSSILITVDDDVFYHKDVINTLMSAHTLHPNDVIANRAHKIRFEKNGKIRPYRKWVINCKSPNSSFLHVPTGVGGVLYPPNSLSLDLLDVNVFKQLCFHADDLWLKAGSLLTNTKVFITKKYRQEFITVGETQRIKLVASNSLGGENDIQFRNVCEFFELDNLERFR